MQSQQSIEVKPVVETLPEFSKDKIRFFGDFLYVEGKGFCEIPPEMRIPEEYNQQQVIKGDAFYHLLEQQWAGLSQWVVSFDPRLKKPTYCALQIETLEHINKGTLRGSWIYVTEFGKIPAIDLFNAIEKKKTHLFTEGGWIDLQLDRFQWLRKVKRVEGESSLLELSTLDFLRLDVQESILLPKEDSENAQQTRENVEKLRGFHALEIPKPTALKSELRLYQKPA